jgi:hypothetical protein
MPGDKFNVYSEFGRIFLRQGRKKTGLSAPIFFAAGPQKRISATIPCAPRGFIDGKQALKSRERIHEHLTCLVGKNSHGDFAARGE